MDIDTSDLVLSHLQTVTDKSKVQMRIMDALQFRLQQAINLKDDEINRLRGEISILQGKIVHKRSASSHDFTAKNNSKIRIQNKIFKSRKETSAIITDMKRQHSKRLSDMMKEYNEKIDKMRKRLEEVIQNRTAALATNSGGENSITKKVDEFLESIANDVYNKGGRETNRTLGIEEQKKVMEDHYRKMSEYEAKLQNNREKERELSDQVERLRSELRFAKAQREKMELDMVDAASFSSRDTKKSPIPLINSDHNSISKIDAKHNGIPSRSLFTTPSRRTHQHMRDTYDGRQNASSITSQLIPDSYPGMQNMVSDATYDNSYLNEDKNDSQEEYYSDTSSEFDNEHHINEILNELQNNYENEVKKLEAEHKKEVKDLMKQIKDCQKRIISAAPLTTTNDKLDSDTKRFTLLNSVMAAFDGMTKEEKEATRKRLLYENKSLKQEVGRLDFMIYGKGGKYSEWRNLH